MDVKIVAVDLVEFKYGSEDLYQNEKQLRATIHLLERTLIRLKSFQTPFADAQKQGILNFKKGGGNDHAK